MIMLRRFGWLACLIVALLLVGLPSYAANSKDGRTGTVGADEIDNQNGKFDSTSAAPDNLTSSQGTKTLNVTKGLAAPNRVLDQGKVRLTSKSGATAVFSGRSTSWGCTYTVMGTYGGATTTTTTATATTISSGDTDGWTNIFDEDKNSRLALEINEDGQADNAVLLGGTAKIRIWAIDASVNPVPVNLTVAPAGKISGVPTTAIHVPRGTSPTEVTITGVAAGNFTVTAEAGVPTIGIGSATVSGKVLGFRGKIVPDDNFAGRSHEKLGVGEIGMLQVEVPTGTNIDDLKPLTWSVLGDALKVSALVTDNGTANFTAKDFAGEVTLTLKDKDNNAITYDISVTPPIGVYMERKPGTTLNHLQGYASVGFMGLTYFLPKDVSFINIQTREQTCKAKASGVYAFQNGLDHKLGKWFETGAGNIDKGSRSASVDRVSTNAQQPPFGEGRFEWPIPFEYRVGETGTPRPFTIVTQIKTCDKDGTCTISKGGHTESAKVNDPDDTAGW